MITRKNLKALLAHLDFKEEGNLFFTKSFGDFDLKVDFENQKIVYPEEQGLKVNEHQTCNFSQNENFVVFECTHRLLEKGYKPEHLELEPKWKVGHGASGGRADILVKDQQEKPLLLIECKTAGDKFEKAWKDTKTNGDQLFSYVQQIPATQFLCLYASDFTDERIHLEQRIISHRDNQKIIDQDKRLSSFSKATDVKSRFSVWRDTYQLEHTESGIFEDNVQPYQIGKSKYTLVDDTKPIDSIDQKGKYHEFRTILRKHNIARRENAFEVLVNLFLCKIVDEGENKDDLKFYWKGIAYDNYFDFVDRLQDLYQRGMGKFLNEEISYISNEQIDSAFWTVKNRRNATKGQIQKYFRELKFFTNSAFSFIDTHNEGLFNKNAKVLLEIVQMWQGLRLKTEEQNQFMGDMFEYFLDNSIKQSNGQFFTPLPICKFIVSSLPLAEKINANPEPLKAIDYACGSGHFLTEYAYQIKSAVEANKRDLKVYYGNITGIEKEDRLAKVAKIASYMYGQEQTRILDADALANHPEVPLESFDVLVANPPFSVDGFLQTLSEDDKKRFELIKATGEKSDTSAIQCFFLERIHHLMTAGGVVGVIVPSSILSNSDSVHIRTRELLLRYFDVVGITELGSGTFGKTGTNTAVLFLRRKAQKPEPAEHYYNRVEDFFEGDTEAAESEYQDAYLIKAYCRHIEVPYGEYTKLFAQNRVEPLAPLMKYDVFQDYQREFEQSTTIRKLKNSDPFKKKTQKEQKAEMDKRLIDYILKIEKDKLYYFILAHEQTGKVLIVKAPSKKKEEKQFLGYEWSSTKGSEGINYNGRETVNDIVTPLFDPENLDNSEKINVAIKNNFTGRIAERLPEHCFFASLTDMLDFNRKDFNKAFNLNPQRRTDIETKWELMKLGEVADIIAGQSPKSDYYNERSDGLPFYQGKKDFGKTHIQSPKVWTSKVTKESIKNDILFSVRAPVGDVNFNSLEKICIGRGLAAIRSFHKDCNQKYIFYFISLNKHLFQGVTGSTFDQISTESLKEKKIPFPPIQVQQKIVNECEAVDDEVEQAHQTIFNTKQKIEDEVKHCLNTGHEKGKLGDVTAEIKPKWKNIKYEVKKLSDVLTLEYGIALPKSKRIDGNFPVYGSNGIVGNHNNFSVEAPCIIIGRKGSAGEVNWSDTNCTPIDTTFYVNLLDENETELKFIYYILKTLDLPSMKVGSGPGGINRNDLYNRQISFPPLKIQKQLVAKMEKLENSIVQYQAVIDNGIVRKNAILNHYL